MPDTLTFEEASPDSGVLFEDAAPEPSVPLNTAQYVAGGGPMAGLAINPPIPDIPRVEGETTIGKIGAAGLNLAASVFNAAKSPVGLGVAVAAPISPLVGAAAGIGFGVPAVYQGLKKVYQAGAGVGGLQEGLEGAGEVGLGASMAVPGVRSLLGRLTGGSEPIRGPSTPEEPLKATGDASEPQIRPSQDTSVSFEEAAPEPKTPPAVKPKDGGDIGQEAKIALADLPKAQTAIDIGIESGALTKEGVPTPAFQGLKPGEASLLMDAITDPNAKPSQRAISRLRARVKREVSEGVLGPQETPPATLPEGPLQQTPSEVAAKVEEVEPSPTEPAKVEGATPQPVSQVDNVTTPVTEGSPGTIGDAEMGAAGVLEIPDTGAGGEKYGVAERIRTERAQAGQVDPVEPGKGVLTEATIKAGREIVRKDPEAGPRIMEEFEADPNKATSEIGFSVSRAHGEALAAGARTIEEQFGTESPEYNAAKEYLSDWDKRTKAMQTQWSNQGKAQMGETDIDTGSFTGLQRARQQATGGEDIPKAKKPQARKIAAENKSAQGELAKASDLLKSRIREKKPTDPEKAAADAASKMVREAAVRAAHAENKARVADEVRRQAVEKVQADAKQAAQDAVDKVHVNDAVRKSRAENKARVDQAQRNKEIADIQAKAARKAQATVEEFHRKLREKAAREGQRRANDPSIAVWEAANKELEETKGLGSFDDIRNKVAADLGMPVSKVTSIMAQDAATKRLAVDMWTKQRNARRLKESAKRWLRELDTHGYQKALATVPRSMFALSVFGHGFVALGTHAPIVAFQPRFWNAYVRNFGRMYKLVFSPAYYEAQMQDLVRRPNYELANKAGLQNDPFQYEEYQTQAARDLANNWIGQKNMERLAKLTGGGNRGYSVLKVLRQDMFDQAWDRLPQKIKVQNGVAEAIADGLNHATGVTKAGAHPAYAIALFAPRLAASRVMWISGDPARMGAAILNWKNATTAEKIFAQNQMREKAWVFGTFASLLAMNQGFLAASGSDQKINGIPEALGGAGFDPMASDFLKFKAHGANIAYGGALLTLCKLPARVGYAIAYEGKGSKYVLEEERVDKVLLGYARTQASPFAGTVADLALGRDFEQRPLPAKLFGTIEQTGKVPKRMAREGTEPYGWLEYAGTRLPIPVAEALKEGLKGSGMPDEQVKYWTKAFGIAAIMTGTGTRITEDTRE